MPPTPLLTTPSLLSVSFLSLSSFPVFYLSFIFIPTQASHVNENYVTWQRFDQVLNRQSASPADGEDKNPA